MWAALRLLCALLVTYLRINRPKRPLNFPLGPPTLLIFGNLAMLIKSSWGRFPTVFKALRGRYASDVIGLVGARPAHGARTRHLRDPGFGKNSLNAAVADESSRFAEHLEARAGREVEANSMFVTSVHIIGKMVADKRCDFEDPERLQLRNVFEGFTERYSTETNAMFSRVIREHRAVLDADNTRDFIDTSLVEMQKTDALPWTKAVMSGVLRYSGFVPLGPPHHTSEGPAQLTGYTIPQSSIVFMHLHSTHHDRTLDEAIMPFGVGKRACLGELLACTELFVFLGCLFQQF
ncbi:cytochrome P450 2B4-like [Pollicipes pollicipes]|uniref:cytochrome P450 2B4-like n=1 Tax=Pollicipes pollicipes TaxID=41117 RepID=UPI001884B0B2|nr:cytochrome P450 2B4-like [Pollicipes pollicipes]